MTAETQGAETHSAYVLALEEPGADLATAGGKGASLATLRRAGLPAPPDSRSPAGVTTWFAKCGSPWVAPQALRCRCASSASKVAARPITPITLLDGP